MVNELIKNFIIFHEDIFPTSVAGPVYEKYLTMEPDMEDMEMADSPAEPTAGDDDLDGESEVTEDGKQRHQQSSYHIIVLVALNCPFEKSFTFLCTMMYYCTTVPTATLTVSMPSL